MKIRIGYWDKSCKEPLYYAGAAHGLIALRTRGGKFRDVLGPMLMSAEHSCFVIDPKGQAAAVTGRYRRDVLGQDVKLINPFKILPEYLGDFEHAQYDPISSTLDPQSDTYAADSDNMAEGWIPYTSSDKHWVDGGRLLTSGGTMYLREVMDRWSLPDVYETISDANLYAFCEDAMNSGTSEYVKARLSRFAGEAAKENREIRSIVSAAISGLSFVANKPIADNMRRSTIDFRDMRKRPMTVYVILPGRYMMSCAPWLRTITNAWADACLQESGGDQKVLGILQEFATSVGNLNSIDTLNAMGAGYGCQIISEFQDLNQLKTLKPNGWQTYLANAGFQIYGATGAGDLFSSEHISRMTGTTEVTSISKSGIDNPGSPLQVATGYIGAINQVLAGRNGGPQINTTQTARRYMLPEEVREMPDNEMLVFAEGVPGVIRAGRRPYYQSPEFAGRYDEDPYHAKKP